MGIKQFIKEKCPNGVEYKTLKEVCEMKRGQSYSAKDLEEGDYPVIAGGKKPAMFANIYNREGETITVSGSGAYAGYLQYWNTPILCTDCFTLKTDGETISCKYVYYFLAGLQDKIYGTKKGGGIPHVHISDIENFMIPVPPIEVQNKIVNTLNNFKELEENLNIELEARRKQFEYYRNDLYSFDN